MRLNLYTALCLSGLSVFSAQAPAATSDTATLKQYTASGYVLGFTPEGILVAGRDHLLKVNFEGASTVNPETVKVSGDSRKTEEGQNSHNPQATPLAEVHYRNLWPGIDLRYDRGDGVLRSTYTLKPYANTEAIRLSYNVPIEITEDGSLKLSFAAGALTESAPIAWQEIEGQRFPVEVRFHLANAQELSFQVGAYDPAQPLIIDPTLTWNTFLGGTGHNFGYGIATDNAGNVYVTGKSEETWGSPVQAYIGGNDAFVAKLNGATGTLAWHTFLGGGGEDGSYGIATDNAGNVYVTGDSTATWGSPVRTFAGGYDAFVAKLDGTSGALAWHTFLGGSGGDGGLDIAADSAGNVYVTGQGEATWGDPVRTFAGSSDAFVAKLNSATGVLAWHTFLGGAENDYGSDIATDSAGNVYVTGGSGATWGSPVRAYTSIDAFVAKLDGATGVLTWNTFLGGPSGDFGYDIATDSTGNVYVTGVSEATWGDPVRTFAGSSDAFVAKLNGATGVLAWHTFLGGAGTDYGFGIAIGGAGNVYVTGWSTAAWGSPWRAYTTGWETFVARLDGNGNLAWNAFLGGAGADIGHGIATDSAGSVYVTGQSLATWGTPVQPYMDGNDAFVAKISDPLFSFTVNGVSSGAISNPVTVMVRNDVANGELFVVFHDPVGEWYYVKTGGAVMPLPSDLSQITPLLAPAPLGSATLFSGLTLPTGDYEVYAGVDYVLDSHLTFLGGAVYGQMWYGQFSLQ